MAANNNKSLNECLNQRIQLPNGRFQKVFIETNLSRSGYKIFKCTMCNIMNITEGSSLAIHANGKKHKENLNITNESQVQPVTQASDLPSTSSGQMVPSKHPQEAQNVLQLQIFHQMSNWEAIQREIIEAKHSSDSTYSKYFTNFNSHPSYLKEWSNFYARMTEQALKNDKDPKMFDFTQIWFKFWLERIFEIKNEELELKIEEIHRKYNVGVPSKRKHSAGDDNQLIIRNTKERFEEQKRARFERTTESPPPPDISIYDIPPPPNCDDGEKDELPSTSSANLPIPGTFLSSIERGIELIKALQDVIGAITPAIIESLETAKNSNTNRGRYNMLNEWRIALLCHCQRLLSKWLHLNSIRGKSFDHFQKLIKRSQLESERINLAAECIEHLQILKISPNLHQPDVKGWDSLVESIHPYFLSTNHLWNYHQGKALMEYRPFVYEINLLSTVLLKVRGKNGKWRVARGLLDSGCQKTLMTQSLAEDLGVEITGKPVDISIAGGNSQATLGEGKVEISSRYQALPDELKKQIKCLVMEKVSIDQPAYQIDLRNYSDLPSCFLADPGSFLPHKIDMVLDCDITRRSRCSTHGSFTLKCGAIVDETAFGWVLGAGFLCHMFVKSN